MLCAPGRLCLLPGSPERDRHPDLTWREARGRPGAAMGIPQGRRLQGGGWSLDAAALSLGLDKAGEARGGHPKVGPSHRSPIGPQAVLRCSEIWGPGDRPSGANLQGYQDPPGTHRASRFSKRPAPAAWALSESPAGVGGTLVRGGCSGNKDSPTRPRAQAPTHRHTHTFRHRTPAQTPSRQDI